MVNDLLLLGQLLGLGLAVIGRGRGPAGSGVGSELGNVVGPLFDGQEYPDVETDHASGRDVEVDYGCHSLESHVGSELRVTYSVCVMGEKDRNK